MSSEMFLVFVCEAYIFQPILIKFFSFVPNKIVLEYANKLFMAHSKI